MGFFAMTIITHSSAAAIRTPMLAVYNISKAIGTFDSTNNDIAAVAAVATIRPALRYVFFPTETNTAGAAITTLDIN